ncbi:protein O-GlcNAc transferase [Gammaproteobacteria bacterium]
MPRVSFHEAGETLLRAAQTHAQSGQFPEMLAVCQQIVATQCHDINALLDVGSLLLNFGFLAFARECFDRARILAPSDLRAVVNLANLARDEGNHPESRRLYAVLLERLPNHPVIRRNALVSLEYDPVVSDADRLRQAKAWGEWAIHQAGSERPRPPLRPLDGRPLRIGYVSADVCQHTVGLFVKPVLEAHDPTKVMAFVYSAGQVKDWVTDAIRACTQYRDVADLDDVALATLIRQDEIDVLVDLSGHTAGSRLTVFAHRPAPVQVSWLGYFATTGLAYLDAVLLDAWHAPPGTEAQFAEPIIRLPMGRFCYQPVPWAPGEVAPPPCLKTGHITFGCFNNTGKLNAGVFDAWAKILSAVPDSRLMLKWRTFADEGLCQSVRAAFAGRGIEPSRIELRGASFHVDVLKEYADIDIALDPFPFTGGLTSCEALWMGVPVVTLPQSRVVSRQTLAFLSAIGISELMAKDAEDYVQIAVELASDRERLATLRSSLCARMRASPLMDVSGFTREFERCLMDFYRNTCIRDKEFFMAIQTILHVGAGHPQSGARLPVVFQTPEWREIRLDIDPANEPDILGSMLDMAAVADGSVDAVYSAHNIEHVHAHEVPVVLGEFHRVLKPEGFLVVTCPDLQTVCALVAEDKLTDAAYQSPAGPITPLDILYGHGEALAAGHHYMAHKCGFTLKTLTQALQAAGFQTIAGKRRARGLDLWMVASKRVMDEATMRGLAGRVLPG